MDSPEMPDAELSARHPAVQERMHWLTPNPNLPPEQLAVSSAVHGLALTMLDLCDDSSELTKGLDRLLDAKDALVRASFPPKRYDQFRRT